MPTAGEAFSEALRQARTPNAPPPVVRAPTARAIARVADEDETRGRGVREHLIAGGEKLLDLLARTEYASAGATRAFLHEKPEEALEAAWRGLTAKERSTFADIAADEFQLSTKPFFAIPDWKYVPNLAEHIGRSLLSEAGITGLAAGMILDPLSWVGVGMLTKLGRLGQVAHVAEGTMKKLPILGRGKLLYPEGSIIREGSAIARQWEAEFARSGRLPEPLAQTLGAQARQGQRALLQIAAPVIPGTGLKGQPIVTLVRGRRLYEASSKLHHLISVKAPQVESALRFFSRFGIPAWVWDNLARAYGELDQKDLLLVKRLRQVAKDLGGERFGKQEFEKRVGVVRRAIESTDPLSEERFRTITRSVPIEERALGSSRFAASAIDEATGQAVLPIEQLDLDAVRAGLGLPAGARLVRVRDLGMQSVASPHFPELGQAPGGGSVSLEQLKEEGAFIGLHFAPRASAVSGGVGFNPEWGPIDRVLVDLDLEGRPEAIQGQITKLANEMKTMTTGERALASETLEGLMRERERAGAPRGWRVSLLRRNPETGLQEVKKVFHADKLDQVYTEVMGPLTRGKAARDFVGTAVYLDDSAIRSATRAAKEQTRVRRLYAARARRAARVEEAIEAKKADVIVEREEEFGAIEAFMDAVRRAGGVDKGGLGKTAESQLEDLYLAYAKKQGLPASAIMRKGGIDLPNQDPQVLEDFAQALGFESFPGSSAAESYRYTVSEMTRTLERWEKETLWKAAKQALYNETNPDLLRLDLYDQVLEARGLRNPPPGRVGVRGTREEQRQRRLRQAEMKGETIEVPKFRTLGQATLEPQFRQETVRALQADVEELQSYREILPRFSNLPDDLRRAALRLERLYQEYGADLLKRGGIKGILPGYIHHALYDKVSTMRRIAGFVRSVRSAGPLEVRTPGFGRKRTIRATVDEINDRSGREFFLNDILTGAALYGREANRFITTHDFVNRTLNRLFHEGVAMRVDPRVLDFRKLDPRFGVYYPAGKLTFYPAKVVPWAKAERLILKSDMKQQGKALIPIGPEDARNMVGVQRSDAVVLPRAVADVLNRAQQIHQTPEGLGLIRQLLLSVRSTWARWTLFPFFSFHLRNGVGLVINNLYRGLTNADRYKEAALVQMGRPFELATKAGTTYSSAQIRDMALRHHAIGADFAGYLAGEEGKLDYLIRKGFGSKAGWKKALDKYGPSGFMQAAMRTSGLVENNGRLALFIDRIAEGDPPELAARAVRETHPSVENLTPVDRFTRSYIMPFWSWTRHNIPMQVKYLIERPGYFATTERLIRLMQASTNPEDEVLPQWMHEALPVRLYESPDNKGEFRYFILRNWLPAADLQTLFEPGRSAMTMLAPWLRLPIERYFNYSFYFRQPIEPPGGSKDVFLGGEFRDRDIELLRSIALLAEIDKVMAPTENVRARGYLEPNFWSRVLQSRFGIGKLYRIELEREQVIARRQHERLIREYKIAQRRALRRGDEATARHLAQRIRDEIQRQPNVVRALPVAVPLEP